MISFFSHKTQMSIVVLQQKSLIQSRESVFYDLTNIYRIIL